MPMAIRLLVASCLGKDGYEIPSGSRQSDDGANPGSAHQTIHHAMFIIWEFFIREMDLMLCGGKVLPTHTAWRIMPVSCKGGQRRAC